MNGREQRKRWEDISNKNSLSSPIKRWHHWRNKNPLRNKILKQPVLDCLVDS